MLYGGVAKTCPEISTYVSEGMIDLVRTCADTGSVDPHPCEEE